MPTPWDHILMTLFLLSSIFMKWELKTQSHIYQSYV